MGLIAFWTILAALAGTIQAQDFEPGALLRCLAKEEASLHKSKRAGPQYKLNQLFFNEWAGNPKLELRRDTFEKVCGNNNPSPSITLLEEFMLGGKNIFRASLLSDIDPMANMQKITLSELRRQMPQVFFSYVADLEALAPTADCLEREIPALAPLREKYRYLESEISLEFLDNHHSEWQQIFSGLEKWQKHFAVCQKRLDLQLKKEAQQQSSNVEAAN